MDFFWRHAGGGACIDIVLVALCAVRQRGDRQSGAALGSILRGDKLREILVRGYCLVVDGVGDLLRQALLVFGGDPGGIFFCGQQKGIGVDDSLALRRNFLRQEAHRHEFVLHAGLQHFDCLRQRLRNLFQSRDVIFVMLYGIERHGKRQIG